MSACLASPGLQSAWETAEATRVLFCALCCLVATLRSEMRSMRSWQCVEAISDILELVVVEGTLECELRVDQRREKFHGKPCAIRLPDGASPSAFLHL